MKAYKIVISGLAIGAIATGVVLTSLPKSPSKEVLISHTAATSKTATLGTPKAASTPASTTTSSTTKAAKTDSTAPAQSQTQDAQAAPVPTVVSFSTGAVDAYNTDCTLTYSDGTTYTWLWQTVNLHGSWVVPGNQDTGGYWATSTQTNGTCDSSVIGADRLPGQ